GADPDGDGEGVGEALRILREAVDRKPAADRAIEERRGARPEGNRRERDPGTARGKHSVFEAHGVEGGGRARRVVERPVARGVQSENRGFERHRAALWAGVE